MICDDWMCSASTSSSSEMCPVLTRMWPRRWRVVDCADSASFSWTVIVVFPLFVGAILGLALALAAWQMKSCHGIANGIAAVAAALATVAAIHMGDWLQYQSGPVDEAARQLQEARSLGEFMHLKAEQGVSLDVVFGIRGFRFDLRNINLGYRRVLCVCNKTLFLQN